MFEVHCIVFVTILYYDMYLIYIYIYNYIYILYSQYRSRLKLLFAKKTSQHSLNSQEDITN